MAPFPSREPLLDRMRAAGLRITGPRRAIARVLEEASDHLDIDEITERAQAIDASIHRATVYRTLSLLKNKGLVDELDLLHVRGDRHYYEISTGDDHAHVICRQCHHVVEPKGDVIDVCRRMLASETGFDIRYMRLEVGADCTDPHCPRRA